MKAIAYKTVAGRDPESLENAVNTAIKDGWQPHGGPLVLVSNFGPVVVQAMVKYQPDLVLAR